MTAPSAAPELEGCVRAALLSAIRHAMEATCGYCPVDTELEEAVAAGLATFRDARIRTPPTS